MTTLDETKRLHAMQIAEILSASHPNLTPGQVAEIQRRAAATINDWNIAPLSRGLNEMIVDGIVGIDRSLTRAVPSVADAIAARITKLKEELGVEHLGAQEELAIARACELMSADDRLNTVPADFKSADAPVSAVEELERATAAKMQQTPQEREEADDRWLKRNFGEDPWTIDPIRRAELLRKRDEIAANAPTLSQRADAQRLDVFAERFGDAADEKLSALDMIARHRARENLKV